nr:hypothetical protein [Tanacetum cinerariifolium]
MSRDVITVGLTMRIQLLYRGEYSQWHERFMNYLEEQTNGEAMINSIQNGLSNDIYSLIDSNETAKDLRDALERQMRGSEYGEQDWKAAILYEYETFKAIELEQLLDTYLRYLQVINDLKKCGYKKTTQNQGYVNDALGYKKKAVVVHSDPLALDAEKTNVSKRKEKVVVSLDSKGSGSDDFSKLKKIIALVCQTDDKIVENKADEKKRDMSKVKCYNCKKAKVKDYNYYKTKMLLAKKDSDEQVLLAEDQAWMESSSDYDQEINANMVFMAQIEKVLSESDESSSSAEENIAEVAYYTSESESESEFETSEYYDNSRIGFENPSYFEKAKDLRPTLYDEKVIGLGYTSMFLTHSNKVLEIENFKRSRENKIEFAYDYGNLNASYVNDKKNFEDDYFQEMINPDPEKIDSPFQQTSSFKPYILNVILEKIIIDLEDEVESFEKRKRKIKNN